MFLVFFYKIKIQNINVSILILMDSILLYSETINEYVKAQVSILILLDSLLLLRMNLKMEEL